MGRRAAWHRWIGGFGGKRLPALITGIYLLCGGVWLFIVVRVVHHDVAMILEDAVYIAGTAVLLYLLLHLGIRTLHKKESALRESEDRLARILETNASGIVVYDEAGMISYINSAASAILGGERSKLIGLRYDDPSWEFTDRNGAPLRGENNPVDMVRINRLPVYDVECNVSGRDGRRVILTVNAAPLLDPLGKMVGTVTSFVDITERKKEEELKLRKLLLAMEQSPSAIVISELEGNVEYANPRYGEMTGCTVKDIVEGKIPHDGMIPPNVREIMRETVRSGNAWRGEFQCCRKNGDVYWEATSVTPIRTAEGDVSNLLWVRDDITIRKEAEEALRRSEAAYRAVVEDQTELICRFSPDGKLSFVNEAYCRYFGKTRADLISGVFPTPPREQEFMERARRRAARARDPSPIEYEIQVTIPGGALRWQRWTERAILDARGGFIEFQAVGSDVTDHRQVDLALHESEEKFRNLVEKISDWVWEIDGNGVYTYVSPKIRDLLGYEPEEVRGRTPLDFVPAPEAVRLRAVLDRIAANREPFSGLEKICLRKDGREAFIETSGAPFFDAEGAFRGYRGVDRDIGERKRAEEMLRASEERFRQLFEQSEEPLFLFRHGTPEILDANPAAVVLYGYSLEELQRQGIALFVPPDDLEQFSSAITGISPASPLNIARASHLRNDGEEIIVSIRAKSVRTRGGLVAYCSFRDISLRIRMEEEAKLQQAQLIHANRMASLGAIVSGVAHEVSNPNNLVMFNAPMILAAWEDALPALDRYHRECGDFTLAGLPYREMRHVVPKLAEGISDASRRIKAIVGNLKDFARQGESNGHKPERINDIVLSAIRILNHEIMKRTHRFEVTLGEDLPPVMGSGQQLEQVVINLLHNALQALTSNEQAVRVYTMRNPEMGDVEVHIVDEGIGMTREVQSRITEPFFSTRLDSGGLGLGLSISRSIVKGHKGAIRFDSEVGKGTRAVVRLPASPSPAAGDGEDPSGKIFLGR